jgi:hypothetical protein
MPKSPKEMSFKARQRDQLQRQIDEFLSRGGHIRQVPNGASGAPAGGDWRHQHFTPRQAPAGDATATPPRVPLTHVIATIEARKQARRQKPPRIKARRAPRRKLIYDDFGEPLRWQWVDE